MSLQTHTKRGLFVIALGVCSLGCGLSELLQATPASVTLPPSATPARDTPETSTPTKIPMQPGAATPEALIAPTITDTPEPLPTDTVAPAPTKTPTGLSIESFAVELVDASGGGKEIHCRWETSGATSVRIVVGTRQRFPIWQDGDPDGTAQFEIAETYYDNPKVTLTARGIDGDEVTENVTLNWPCTYAYFFSKGTADPGVCPSTAALRAQGAQQPFQDGAMLWIPGFEDRDWIYVLHNDGTWQRYEDMWQEGMEESDPGIVPPTGYHQPIRGFGLAWRKHPEVRSKLGWATTGESAVAITAQKQMQESIGGVQYIQSANANLLRLDGIGGSGSTWTSLP